MTTLYQYTAEADALYQLALAADEMDDEQAAAAIAEAFANLQGEIADKLERCAAIIADWQSDAAALRAEEDRLAKRRKTLEAQSVRLKESMQAAMQAADIRKSKGLRFTVAIQANPPRTIIDADVPADYLIPQPPKVDTKAIAARLKDGEILPFAHLEQGESLRIR